MIKAAESIGIRVAPGGQDWLGGINYVKNLLRGLRREVGTSRRLCLIQHSAEEDSIYQDIYGEVDQVLRMDQYRPNFRDRVLNRLRGRWGNCYSPLSARIFRKHGIDFVYSALLHRNRTEPDDLRSAFWMPDFQFVHQPDGSNRAHGAAQLANFREAARHSRRIVLSSADAERDCLKILPEAKGFTHIYRFKSVLPDSVLTPDPTELARKLQLPERFMLVANLLAPTKNHLGLIAALASLRKRGIRIPVVCTGSLFDYRNPGYVNNIMDALFRSGIHAELRFTGPLPRHEQLQLMRAAVAIIQPSRFEGWNTGVEEARSLGKPLVLSTLSVHQEQLAGTDSKVYWCDPGQPEQIASALEHAWKQEIGFSAEREAVAWANYGLEIRAAARSFLQICDY